MSGNKDTIDQILGELARAKPPSPPPAVVSDNGLEKLLTELEGKSSTVHPPKLNPLDALLDQVKSAPTSLQSSSPLNNSLSNSLSNSLGNSVNNSLNSGMGIELSTELQQAATIIRKQAEILQKEQEQLKRQQRQAQEQKAQDWLKQMDWLSSDGIWFEQFARNYPSPLEAAIVYLFGDSTP
jgi:hypothetical protein